jgi:MFS transporter, ACS family, hexuronate transporter
MGRLVRTVGVVLTWQVAASVCYYAVFAATPFFRETFGLSRFLVGLVITSLTLGYTALLLPTGALIDGIGERRVLVAGLLGMGLVTGAVTLAPSYPALLAVVFCLGVLYATAIPGTNRAIFESIPEGRQHLALGIKQVGVTAGSGISAVLITSIAGTRWGWETGFLLAGALALCVAAVFSRVYAGDGGTGSVELPDLRALFGRTEYRRLTAAGFFLGAGLFTTTGYTILYVAEDVGASVDFAGVVLAAVQVGGSAGRVVSGGIGDYLPGPEGVATTRVLLVQAACSALAFGVVVLVDSPYVALAAFTLLGFFVLGFTGMYYSCMSTLVADDAMGRATAGGQLTLNGGALLGPPAFGLLADVAGYDPAWLALGVAALVATGLLATVERRVRRESAM